MAPETSKGGKSGTPRKPGFNEAGATMAPETN